MISYDFNSFDNKRISVKEWSDVVGAKGVIQISHGMAEHVGRYDIFARYMNEHGYVVFGDDHRGHGDTDPVTPGYCAGDMYNDTIKDMALIAQQYKQKYALPLYLFSHSYGSFLAQRYIQLYPGLFDAVVIGGSGYMNNYATKLGGALSRHKCNRGKGTEEGLFVKKASFDRYDRAFGSGSGLFISSLEEERARYLSDKKCNFVCSYNFYSSFLNGVTGAYTEDALKKIDKSLPILLISGKDDPVGDMGKGVEKLAEQYEKLGLNVNTILYEGVRHEYLNDTSRRQALNDIEQFFSKAVKKTANS